MRVVRRELHYEGSEGGALCGQRGKTIVVTKRIADATCRKCVEKIYHEAVIAHRRAFPECVGPRMRRLERAAVARRGKRSRDGTGNG